MGYQYSTDELLAALRRVPFFATLAAPLLADLAAGAKVRRFPAGARLILEGTYGRTFYILLDGEAEAYKRRQNEKVVLSREGAGSTWGEMGLLEGGLRTATVETTQPSTVMEISKAAFELLLHPHADVASTIIRELNGRMRRSDNRMVDELLTVNANLRAAQRHIEETYDRTLEALSSALDLRDTETEGHARRVTDYVMLLGRSLGLAEPQMRVLYRGALLHDIGKIGVPDAVLRKPGRLMEEERALIRLHPAWGASILQGIPFLEEVLPLVRHHHEWWDGSGYPDGLAGEAIPLFARLFAIADTFDALTSVRPYRPASEPREALSIMRRETGTHLDPSLFCLFDSLFDTAIEPLCRAFRQAEAHALQSATDLTRY